MAGCWRSSGLEDRKALTCAHVRWTRQAQLGLYEVYSGQVQLLGLLRVQHHAEHTVGAKFSAFICITMLSKAVITVSGGLYMGV
jgi:hypothetical protein